MTSTDENRNDRLKFGALEVGRAVAAGLVVFHHAGSIMEQPRFFGAAPFDHHLGNFNVGVDFFFVLSGFIIAWVHWGDIGESGRVPRYALKRFLRIYPPYWAILVPLIALYLAFPQSGIPTQRDPINIVMSILLLPYPVPPVLGVAWTLVHEIFFYALFAIIIATGRRALLVLPVWFIAIAAVSLAKVEVFPITFFFSPFNMQFILGVGVAVLMRHRRVRAPFWMAAFGIAAFLGFMLFATDIQSVPLIGRLAFGVPAAMFIAGCVEMERRRPRHLPRSLALLGAASYAIYLVHPVALSFGVQILSRLPTRDWPIDVVVLLLATIGIVAGIVFHVVIEKRIIAALRGLTAVGRTTNRGAAASSKA